VLLLHGLTGSNRYFGHAFDTLADHARLVVPDLLGFGDSPHPDRSAYDPEAHARAVLKALDTLGVEGPIYIGAHSAGSIVALRVAALRPGSVRGIVAFGPPLYRSEKEARARVRALGSGVRFFAMDTPWAAWACKTLRSLPGFAIRLTHWIRPELPDPVASDVVKHTWRSYSGTIRNLVFANQPPVELSSLEIPLRIIVGAEDDVVDVEFLREISEAHPRRVELEIWDGGHNLPLDDAARSVEAIRKMTVEG
jgi:pimeloyl-ACP methyl ester carboxylesterase